MAEEPMIAEVVIHLGSEWRDVLIMLFGVVVALPLGAALEEAWQRKQKK
jgi:hypothetical protein